VEDVFRAFSEVLQVNVVFVSTSAALFAGAVGEGTAGYVWGFGWYTKIWSA